MLNPELGHSWGPLDVSMPVTQINRIGADAIYLKQDKHALSQLPSIAIPRCWIFAVEAG